MDRKMLFSRIFIPVLTAIFFLTGCGGSTSDAAASSDSPAGQTEEAAEAQPEEAEQEAEPEARRPIVLQFPVPEASGTTVYGNDLTSIDASNVSEGYVMVQYSGSADLAKIQITIPDQTKYTYTVPYGSYGTYPLTGGSGLYHIDVLEHAYDDMYALGFSQDIEVALNDEFKPFLYPNQYSWYTRDSQAVKKALSIAEESSTDIDFVERVYTYVTENITYDVELAANVQPNYIPNIDTTLESGKGICFDYAALMTSMLRSQGVPTKLEVGYSGEAYHAWISVYLTETGWVNNIIEFNGQDWSLMDPTLAASNSASAVAKYIGDGSNYTVKYSY